MNNLTFYGKMTMGDFMYIRNILDDDTYLNEYIKLCSMEWGDNKTNKEMEEYVEKKKEKIKIEDKVILVLGLFDTSELVGFISLFKYDGDERKDLTPWYATMYVKRQYRGKGYSKVLNDALIEEALNLGYNRLYLKSSLINYYEKFGAIYMKDLECGEKLYYIDCISKSH